MNYIIIGLLVLIVILIIVSLLRGKNDIILFDKLNMSTTNTTISLDAFTSFVVSGSSFDQNLSAGGVTFSNFLAMESPCAIL